MMASQGVAILENRLEYNDAFATFGQHFGNAFQIIDDVLDFVGDSEVLGKNVGDDIAEGKPTLPLIKALEMTTVIRMKNCGLLFRTGEVQDTGEIIEIVKPVALWRIAATKRCKKARR